MKILLIGHGKMGQLIERLAPEHNATIAAITKRDPSPLLPQQLLSSIDVAIDFSGPEGITHRLETLLQHKIPIVIGTTGWEKELPHVEHLTQKYNGALIAAANFSIGATLFLQLLETAARLINPFAHYDVAVLEQHHNQKKDHPSGTALALTNILLEQIERKKYITHDLQAGTIAPEALHVTSIRAGNHPGQHTIMFDGPDDTITLTHSARNRNDFARGALNAAQWIIGKQGFFTLKQVVEGALSSCQ